MNPDIAPGETNIQMTWETNPPQDMDLYVAAIRNSNDDICLIPFDNPNCDSASLTRSGTGRWYQVLDDVSVFEGTMLKEDPTGRRLSS